MPTNEATDFLTTTLRKIYPQNTEWRDRATAHIKDLTMPLWALGDLLDLAVDLAGMTRSLEPPVARKEVVVMVGDHGVAAEGVSQYPVEVTTQMAHNMAQGGAGASVLAAQVGAGLTLVDVGARDDFTELAKSGAIISKKISHGTDNILKGPAMSRTHAVMSVEAGIEVANSLSDRDLLATGEIGIGNTTPAAAIAAVVTGQPPAVVTGRGSGLNDTGLARKIQIIEKAIAVNKPDPQDALDILAKVGGFEIGAIAGLILGAAANRKPVVVDGFISTAGALIACKLEPIVRDYIILGHASAEPGHTAMREFLGKKPLLQLNMRLGEGTGAVLAMHLVDAAVAILSRMATFSSAGVSTANKP